MLLMLAQSRGLIAEVASMREHGWQRELGRDLAALDVYDEEPLPMNSPLRDPELTGSGRLPLSPNLGYATEQTWKVFYSQTIEAIAAWQNGTPIRRLN